MNDKTYFSLNVMLFVVILTLAVITSINLYYLNKSTDEKVFSVVNVSECSNMSLEDTSRCLRNWLKGFYNYTITKDGNRTLEEIKKDGGDCWDYNYNLYRSAIETLGFDSAYTTMKIGNSSYHVVTFISNSEGYCLLDQTNYPFCATLGGTNDTKS